MIKILRGYKLPETLIVPTPVKHYTDGSIVLRDTDILGKGEYLNLPLTKRLRITSEIESLLARISIVGEAIVEYNKEVQDV